MRYVVVAMLSTFAFGCAAPTSMAQTNRPKLQRVYSPGVNAFSTGFAQQKVTAPCQRSTNALPHRAGCQSPVMFSRDGDVFSTASFTLPDRRPLSVLSCELPAPLLTVRGESDELRDLKKAAHTGSDDHPAPAKQRRREKRDDCSNAKEDDGSGSLFGQLAFSVVASPFTIPVTLLEDDYDHVTEFPDFPYAEGTSGSLLRNSFEAGTKQTWTGTLQTFAIPQAHDVDRFGGRLLLDSASRFGIDTETNFWTQGRLTGPHDQLWTGDANLVFRFAESEKLQWRAGAGVNWLSDNVRTEAGINLTYGVEWFPARPWTVSSVFDFGSLGASGLFHNRTTVGAMVGQTEFFAGYDYFQLGSARFHGPVAGIGWRF